MGQSKRSFFYIFFIIWIGQLVSSIGTGITAFALGVYVFRLTGSAANYSLIILASFLPTLLLKPFGGVIVDRLNRRLMMILGDFGSALGVLFIVLLLLFGVKGLWFLYVGAVISAVFVSLQNPAYKASITDLVDEKSYGKASGLMQLAESAKYLISPAVAGLLVSHLKIADVLIIDVCTFLFAILMVLFSRKEYSPVTDKIKKASMKTEFLAGFRYTFSHKGLVMLLLIISLVSFFIGILQALLGPMILSFTTAKVFGLSQTLMAIGMLLSSLVIGVFGRSDKRIPALSLGLCLAGIFFALLGLTTNIVIVTIFGFLFFLALPIVNTSLDVLVRRHVDNEVQGRVWGIVSLLSQFGMVISLAGAGYLADKVVNPLLMKGGALVPTVGAIVGIGPGRGIALILFVSGLCVAAIGLVVFRMKVLRTLDVAAASE